MISYSFAAKIFFVTLLTQLYSANCNNIHSRDSCDFPSIHKYDNLEIFEQYRGKLPVVLKGFMHDWQAQQWTREAFIEKVGHISVAVRAAPFVVRVVYISLNYIIFNYIVYEIN
jgi:hypothetical protein